MRSRRQPLAVFSAEDFLETLRASGLLPPHTVAVLAAGGVARAPRAWASELVERGLLTGYQAEQILAGNARSLLLGQYRILDSLGAGGMGRVYKAEHVLMRRLVALKVVGATDDDANTERQAAFQREIEAAARLSHPNVVAAYDAGEANGRRFLVMEYVDGVDLDRLVREVGPLPPRRAADYGRQTALALQYAFERGVLHRDVKPANLLAEHSEGSRAASRVKVLDLGLALNLRAGGDCDADAASRLSGTPDYIAPEVAHDAACRDVRSDLYSIGCTLYYLLTGRVPFPGGTWTEKLLRHQYDAPLALRELAPGVPPALAAIVERLMAKRPGDRYDTPAAAAQALDDWLAQGEDPPALQGASAEIGAAPAEVPVTPSARLEPSSLQALNAGPASAWDLLAAAIEPPPGPRPPAPRPLPWLVVIAGAVTLGLGAAWLARGRMAAQESAAAAPRRMLSCIVESTGHAYPTLAVALAAASDGDTVLLEVDGPFPTEPVILTGKALTLRAAPGCRPALQFATPPAAWQALLASDRPLTLEGIELREAPGKEPAHLICVTGGALRLVKCRVSAPRRSSPIVARQATRVELTECDLLAGELALCAELAPQGACAMVLRGNRIVVGEFGAAALSVWPGGQLTRPAKIDLEANNICAARILSLNELTAGVAVTARRNHFDFDETLLCLNGCDGPDGWRRTVTWHGQDNHYRGLGDWLHINGRSGGVNGLSAWQATWADEGASLDELSASQTLAERR